MENRWSDSGAAEALSAWGGSVGEDLALRTYTTHLLGGDSRLVLHGGGNTSVKTTVKNRLGLEVQALFVKASGLDMGTITPAGFSGLDLGRLLELRGIEDLTDEEMEAEVRIRLLDHLSKTPSLETLVHAFLPQKFIDHTHAETFLTLTNLSGGERLMREAFGDELIVLPYVKPGFALAREAGAAFERNPKAHGMVLMHHGLFTWGTSAREAYERMIGFVERTEQLISSRIGKTSHTHSPVTDENLASARYRKIAPLLRGLLAAPTGNPDRPHRNVILAPLTDRRALDFVDSEAGRAMALTSPLTTDYLVRTKPLPLWIDCANLENLQETAKTLGAAAMKYADEYKAYVARHADRLSVGLKVFDPLPRVVFLPGVGAVGVGRDTAEAAIVRDITAQAIAVKSTIASLGTFSGLSEDHLFEMEYRGYQHAKLDSQEGQPLSGRTAIVTGAAGAIGSGICRALLEAGCHVAVTDLAGPRLEDLGAELSATFGPRVMTVIMDVTDPASVANGFEEVFERWGGVDLVIVNAGLAHVATLMKLRMEDFRRVERVNTEGTLNLLAEAGRHFRLQSLGGDIVLVSTKNVFAPGASFGAYSATKAAAHQLARIASQEFAPLGVRVNMVAPDAVFSEGEIKSGLWQEVGPDRMKARGLDEAGLEEYYRNRNLLKSHVTARHVANAVLYFATRQSPTTGATIPVDGGLPDATPR